MAGLVEQMELQHEKHGRAEHEKPHAKEDDSEQGERGVGQEDDEEIQREGKRGAQQGEAQARTDGVLERGEEQDRGVDGDERVNFPRLEILGEWDQSIEQ